MFQELQLAHCRNMRRRNLVRVPTTEVPDIPFIPNVTGKACALVVSIKLMKCLELPENFALLCFISSNRIRALRIRFVHRRYLRATRFDMLPPTSTKTVQLMNSTSWPERGHRFVRRQGTPP
jgi:hypothetical protein